MKAILLLMALTFWLLADTTMSFKEFKLEALKNSNTINAQKLSIDIALQDADISQSYANPSIEAGKNRFKDDSGWQVGISQAIRLPGFGSDLKNLNNSKIELSYAAFTQQKALFIKELESRYIDFVYQKQTLLLLQKELDLAKEIENISKNRLQNGVGTKANHLRALIETKSVETKFFAHIQSVENYHLRLLQLASKTKLDSLEAKFIYPVLEDFNYNKTSSPTLEKMQKLNTLLKNEIEVAGNGIKSIDISAGYEKEPDDKILSLGVGIALPIFSTSREKAGLARIKQRQNSYELEQLKISEELQKEALLKSLSMLKEQYKSLLAQKEVQINLLELYQESYKISKGSLLELIDVKNRLLQTSKDLLDTNKDANKQRIQLNYIQGTYNE